MRTRPWSSATAPSCASAPARRCATAAAPAGTSSGDLAALDAAIDGDRFDSDELPRRALAPVVRRCAAPHAGDILISADARLRVRRLGRDHPLSRAAATARSHAGDSLGPLLLCGFEPGHRDAARAVGAARRRRARARALRTSTTAAAGSRRRTTRRRPAARRSSDAAATRSPRIHLGTRKPRQLGAAAQVRPRRRLRATSSTSPSSRCSPSRLDVHHIPAAIGAFCVAVSNNFWLEPCTGPSTPATATPAFRRRASSPSASSASASTSALLELLVTGAELPELPAQALAVALAMPVNFIGNKLWTFGAKLDAGGGARARPDLGRAGPRRPDAGSDGRLDRGRARRARLPAADAGGLRGHRRGGDRDRRRAIPKVAEQTATLRHADDARSRSTTTTVWQVGYKAGDREVVQVKVDGITGAVARVVDRLPGRLADGARLRGPVRPRAQRALRLDPAGADLPPRPVRLPPPAADRPPRPARAARVRGLARLLQPRRDRRLGAARLPAARLPARAHALDRLSRRRAAAPERCPRPGSRSRRSS